MQVDGLDREPVRIPPREGETLAAFVARLPLPPGKVVAELTLNGWDRVALPLDERRQAVPCRNFYWMAVNLRRASA